MGTFEIIESERGLIKAWTRGVPVEEEAKAQLRRIASMPFIHQWVAAMPDVHLGIGATVGSVIATDHAIIPAAVGVDIGCGMMAARLDLPSERLPDSLAGVRAAIEAAVPHGRTHNGRPNLDRGAWHDLPEPVAAAWKGLSEGYDRLVAEHPRLGRGNDASHLGTLGTGNHFVELCLDEDERVWVMLHSGSRGVGNRIGQYFIELAKQDMRRFFVNLPDQDLAYFPQDTDHFEDYVRAVGWAQDYARTNRELMMAAVLRALRAELGELSVTDEAVNCHHNYVSCEHHYGKDVWVTRKGAVRARAGELGIIPGSMGTRSYIVSGKGNPESFHSCSHGAGRAMSRGEARRRFTVADHERMTAGIECRKDADVIDETPAAYKPIDAVMQAQSDLVEVVHELRQIVCVKG